MRRRELSNRRRLSGPREVTNLKRKLSHKLQTTRSTDIGFALPFRYSSLPQSLFPTFYIQFASAGFLSRIGYHRGNGLILDGTLD
jgi:hypothetical protein